MSKFSGGIATDWTNVRATGSQIKTIDVTSQGVIPFLKIANDSTVAIARSGRRIGATAVYLESWHLDIEDFLELRKNTGDERRRTHDINTANWIPDLFMKRVMADAEWTLFSPDDTPDLHDLYGKAFEKRYAEYEKLADKGEIVLHKRVSAAALWRKMLSMLFETGHPWITFKDPSNLRSPQDHVGVVHNSNLCTEITLNNSKDETAVCNLGSVNLAQHMAEGTLDVELLQDTIRYAVRMLDNVIDLCYYVTKETERANMNNRPVGLGIMGHQDALYVQNIDFASEAAVQFADESMEIISYYAIKASSELAQERGAYKTYKGSKWDRGIFPADTLDILERERGQKLDIPRGGKLDWKPVRAQVKKHGMRNSNVMAIAPTASIANVAGCVPCIEPIYKNLYVKSNMSGDFTVLNSYLIDDLKELGLWSETMLGKIKYFDGSIQQIDEIPAKIRAKYKEVFEIEPEWLIKAAAYRGKWIDQSQSLNIYMRGVSGKKLSDAYMYAWKMGLKTTYYLRTLAASQVEKSTVSTSEFGATHKRNFEPTPTPAA
jgi:ribonucleoside-diphosphate reductase alpha chain